MLNGIFRSKSVFAGVGIALLAAAAAGYDGNLGVSQERDRGANRPASAKQVPQVLHPDWFAVQAPILHYQKEPARKRG